MRQVQQILNEAYEKGVEVRWAKRTADIEHEGIHLMDPTFERMVEGLCYALIHGVDLVVIHSGITWTKSLRLIRDESYSIPGL